MRKSHLVKLLVIFIVGILPGIFVSLESFTEVLSQPKHNAASHVPDSQKVKLAKREKVFAKYVALTFDDGPDPVYTPRILDILADEKVQATFFVVGKSVKKNPEIIRRAAMQGNMIENHSWSHPRYHRLTEKQIKYQLTKTSKEISRITGRKPVFFRPPRGALSPKIKNAAIKSGYRIVLWTDSVRASVTKSPEEHARDISRLATNGSIILLHDGMLNREKDVKTLPCLIRNLKKRGFTFVTLDYFLNSKDKMLNRPLLTSL